MLNNDFILKNQAGHKRAAENDDGQQWMAEIKTLMRNQRNKQFAEVVLLTPSRAAALLASNPDNRNISKAKVNTFASDILNGRWDTNGQGVIISDTGHLNDGQHRCHAVIASGKAIETWAVFNVPRDTRNTVDTGWGRTSADFLTMNGVGSAKNVAAIAVIMHAFENNLVGSRGVKNGEAKMLRNVHKTGSKPTKPEILAYAMENMPEIQKAMRSFEAADCAVIGTYCRFCAMAIVIARACKSWTKAEAYIKAIIDGEAKKDTAVHTVRKVLTKEKTNGTLTPFVFFSILIKGWNAYRKNEAVSYFKMSDSLPEIEG